MEDDGLQRNQAFQISGLIKGRGGCGQSNRGTGGHISTCKETLDWAELKIPKCPSPIILLTEKGWENMFENWPKVKGWYKCINWLWKKIILQGSISTTCYDVSFFEWSQREAPGETKLIPSFLYALCLSKVGRSKSEAFDLSHMPQILDKVRERLWLK